jgi:hypothetical protein
MIRRACYYDIINIYQHKHSVTWLVKYEQWGTLLDLRRNLWWWRGSSGEDDLTKATSHVACDLGFGMVEFVVIFLHGKAKLPWGGPIWTVLGCGLPSVFCPYAKSAMDLGWVNLDRSDEGTASPKRTHDGVRYRPATRSAIDAHSRSNSSDPTCTREFGNLSCTPFPS